MPVITLYYTYRVSNSEAAITSRLSVHGKTSTFRLPVLVFCLFLKTCLGKDYSIKPSFSDISNHRIATGPTLPETPFRMSRTRIQNRLYFLII